MRTKFLAKALTGIYVLCLAVIVFLADRSGSATAFRLVTEFPFGDKIGHLFLAGGLSFALNLIWDSQRVGFWRFNLLIGAVIAFSLAAVEEFSQIFVSGRTFDLTDLLADFIGIVVFGEIAALYQRRKNLDGAVS